MPRFWTVLLVLFPLSPAFGQDVGFEEAITLALRQHPLAEVGQAEVAMADASAKEAASWLYPRVILGESLYWTNEPGGSMFISLNQEQLVVSPDSDFYNHPPDRQDFVTRLELLQPLYDSDLWYSRKQARQAADAVKAQTGFNDEQLAFAAFSACLEVQSAEAAVRWAELGQKDADEVLRLARERQTAGVGLKAETLRAEVQQLQAQQRMLAARNDLILVREQLAMAIGSEQQAVGFSGPLPEELFRSEPVDSLGLRGDLHSLELQLQQAETARQQSRAAYLPKAGLSADYSLHDEVPFGASGSSWSVRANLSWELFDGLRRSHSSERALAAQRAIKARKRDAERQAQLEVRRADLKSQEAELQLISLRRAHQQAEESSRLYRERYAAGISSLADLLVAQRDLEQARFALVKAEADWFRSLGNRALQRGKFVETALAGKETIK